MMTKIIINNYLIYAVDELDNFQKLKCSESYKDSARYQMDKLKLKNDAETFYQFNMSNAPFLSSVRTLQGTVLSYIILGK